MGALEGKGFVILVAVVVGAAIVLGLTLGSYADLHYYEIWSWDPGSQEKSNVILLHTFTQLMGFVRTTTTGNVDTSKVYEAGRHWFGPAKEFKIFPAIAHTITLEDITIFTSTDKLEITLNVTVSYFLVNEDLKLLHDEYNLDYEDLMKSSAQAAIKDTANDYTLIQFVEDRELVEKALHQGVQNRLGGVCCPKDCSLSLCANDCKTRSSCEPGDKGLFVDVRYFQLTNVEIPADVEARNLAALVLTEETLTESYYQQSALITKETEQMIDEIENQAAEVRANAAATAELINERAQVEYQRILDEARKEGLTTLFSSVGLSDELHKNSFDYLRTLSDLSSAHLTVDFDQLVAYTGGK